MRYTLPLARIGLALIASLGAPLGSVTLATADPPRTELVFKGPEGATRAQLELAGQVIVRRLEHIGQKGAASAIIEQDGELRVVLRCAAGWSDGMAREVQDRLAAIPARTLEFHYVDSATWEWRAAHAWPEAPAGSRWLDCHPPQQVPQTLLREQPCHTLPMGTKPTGTISCLPLVSTKFRDARPDEYARIALVIDGLAWPDTRNFSEVFPHDPNHKPRGWQAPRPRVSTGQWGSFSLLDGVLVEPLPFALVPAPAIALPEAPRDWPQTLRYVPIAPLDDAAWTASAEVLARRCRLRFGLDRRFLCAVVGEGEARALELSAVRGFRDPYELFAIDELARIAAKTVGLRWLVQAPDQNAAQASPLMAPKFAHPAAPPNATWMTWLARNAAEEPRRYLVGTKFLAELSARTAKDGRYVVANPAALRKAQNAPDAIAALVLDDLVAEIYGARALLTESKATGRKGFEGQAEYADVPRKQVSLAIDTLVHRPQIEHPLPASFRRKP